MRIGLDIAPLNYPPSGVRAYVEALIDAFRSRDTEIELAPLLRSRTLIRTPNRLERLQWDTFGIASAAHDAEVDLLHMTRFAAPRAFDRPLVVTIHDLIPLLLPAYRASLPARIQLELAQRTVVSARRIIVPTRVVARDVTGLLGFPPERIDIIPMGVSIPASARTTPPIAGPYLLHTGGFDLRKNLPALVRAFATALPQLDPDWRLVLMGAPHSGNARIYPPLQPEIDRLALNDRIIMTGRVSEIEKHALYQHATLAIAPSLNEGFGLPILEAMAYGIPVIASNCTSHPEVAGDAALLVEPTEEAMTEAIIRLASDTGLRADLARRGRHRALQFPWSRTAALTIETYRNALCR